MAIWENAAGGKRESAMQDGRMIIGNKENIWTWDGGECQPVSRHPLFSDLGHGLTLGDTVVEIAK